MSRGGPRPNSGQRSDGLGPRILARVPTLLLERCRDLATGYQIQRGKRSPREARQADVLAAALAVGLEVIELRGLQTGIQALEALAEG